LKDFQSKVYAMLQKDIDRILQCEEASH